MYTSPLAKKILARFQEREDTYDYTLMIHTQTGATRELSKDTIEQGPYVFPFGHLSDRTQDENMAYLNKEFAGVDVFTVDNKKFFTEEQMQLILLPHINRHRIIVMQMLRIENLNGVYEALLVTGDMNERNRFERAYIKAQEEREDD